MFKLYDSAFSFVLRVMQFSCVIPLLRFEVVILASANFATGKASDWVARLCRRWLSLGKGPRVAYLAWAILIELGHDGSRDRKRGWSVQK